MDARLFWWGWNALEADFLRLYNIELTKAVWEEGMTLHKLMVLVTGLPSDSAFVRFIDNDDNYSAAILYK